MMKLVPSDPSVDMLMHAPEKVERLSKIGLGWIM
jgi:hypothetical protein